MIIVVVVVVVVVVYSVIIALHAHSTICRSLEHAGHRKSQFGTFLQRHGTASSFTAIKATHRKLQHASVIIAIIRATGA